MARAGSLKWQLLLTTLGVIGAGSLLIGAVLLAHARHEIDELFDAQLAQMARTLLVQGQQGGDDDADHPAPAHRHEYERKIGFALFDHDGRLLRSSSSEPAFSHLPDDCEGFHSRKLRGQRLRTFCASDGDSGHIIVAWQNHAIRNELAGKIVGTIFLPVLLGIPLLAALVWWSIGRVLQPLTGLSQQIGQRSARDLAPIDPASVPDEIEPIISKLNQLLGRIASALEQERRFTADAAHELRTPLAALQIQIEVAQGQPDPQASRITLNKALVAVRRATSLVEQLLQLARLDEVSGIALQPVALDELATALLADHADMAAHKQIELALEGSAPQPVLGQCDLLQIMLRNLLTNAIQYTPPGGQVTLQLAPGRIEVIDNGPGIDTGERQRLLQRFARGSEVSNSGHGLGLSIVTRIAELHQARFELADAPTGHGLRATVEFPHT